MASSTPPDLTSQILKHERPIVAGGIVLLVALSWWFLATGAGIGDHSSGSMAMPGMAPPPLSALVLMWWLMMVAMMLPSAAPAILLYARVRSIRSRDGDVAASWIFLLGYLAVWLGFSVLAAIAQQVLTGPSMAVAGSALPGALLIAAGLYQLSPIKSACLRQCRSPAQFISRHWRAGPVGAARLGVLHGAYCVGCCWLLMALLFVGGVMNFAWIAALTLIVGAEKLLPRGEWIARLAGLGLIAWGGWLLIS
jgi:predicted metal-binding membrane protein